MTTVVISQPMLFPWVGLFEQVALADVFVHYDDVQFSKGSFTNRVQVKTAGGPVWMTVPLKRGPLGTRIDELVADDDRGWRDAHRRLLADACADAPHVDAMLAIVDDLYGRSGSLCDWLIAGVEAIAAELDLRPAFHRSSDLGIDGRSDDRVLRVVQHFGGDVYVTGHGAKRYLDAQRFEDHGVEVRYMDYSCRPYPQQHGEFTPYVTSLDLLANTGPEAASHLDPRTVDWRSFTST